MTTRKKVYWAGGILAGLLVVLVAASLIIVQTQWFQNFVRDKIIATAEESTGGKVEIGSFRLDIWHLSVRITDFTLHGTEAPGTLPLARVDSLDLRLKLFAGLKKTVDLSYLGITNPKVNLIVNADGTTNIPAPKIKKAPSQTSGLETVVDLAVGEFRIDNGTLLYSQKTSKFAAQGNDLRVLLNFNSFNSTYAGRLLIDPLVLSTGSGAPLRVSVNLPVLLEKDAVSISGGRMTTAQSQILINAGLRDLNSPQITARVNANLALKELNVDVDQHLTADLGADYDDKSGAVEIKEGRLNLGQSSLNASGTLRSGGNQAIQFNGKLAMDELSRWFKVSSPIPLGSMQLRGHVKSAAPQNYALDAQVDALGGNSTINALVENMQKLTVNVHLSHFALSNSGYSGVIGGTLDAQTDLKAKDTTGLLAHAHILVAPGSRGVPVSGQINGQFLGANNSIRLEKSYVALPHSRVDLQGEINKQLTASLTSRNLNDFAPLAPNLPVTLQGGSAKVDAQVEGNLSAPQVKAHAAMDHFAVHGTQFQQLALDLAASQNGAAVSNGILSSSGLNSNFEGSIALRKWKPLPRSAILANVSIPSGQLASILALAGQPDPTASGTVNAEAHVMGTYGDPLGSLNLEAVNGVVSGQPFQKIQGHVDLAHELITLTNLEVDAAGGRLQGHGTFRHPSDSFQTGHADFHVDSSDIQLTNIQPLQKQSPGVAGILKLVADASGDLRNNEFQVSNVSADFFARSLKINNQAAGDLSGQARTANGQVTYNVHSNFAGSAIQVDGTSSLAKDYVTKATASIQNLPVEQALGIAGQGNVPVRGLLSLNGNVSGTLTHPEALFNLTFSNATVYQERLTELSTQIHYTPTLVDIPNFTLQAPAGSLAASAHFAHKDGDFNNGQVQLRLTSLSMDLSKIKQLETVSGSLKLNADIAGELKDKKLLLSDANADLNASAVRASDMNLGELHATAKTTQHVVHYNVESNIAKSRLNASGQTELLNNYMTHAKLTLGQFRWSNLTPEKPSFDVLLDGEANVDGPVLDLDALTGSLRLNQIIFDAGARSRKVHIENDAPAVVTLAHSVLKVEHLKVQDAKTYLQAAGSVSLKDANNALGLKVQGNADLSILQNVDRDFYSSGTALLDADIHGSLAKPLVNGRVELKNAGVNYVDASNGLSNGNGVILLNGTNATIQNLTGESGGGKIAITGFAGFSPTDLFFNVRATATKVRTRYADASITTSADISLAGNAHRSTLSGLVTIQRISYSSSSDVGSFLSTASTPPSTPSAPSPFLSGMRLDLRIVTAPDLRVISTYSDKLSLTSSLTLSGTAQDPGIVGRVNVTSGQLVFFGNSYSVNSGSINFYNTNSINPILDLSLETLTQGVDVTLGVTGPVNNLKLSYRSDPPLSFQQIVQLLATNTTPSDPTIAAHQPTPPQQSASQLGESAVLGTAVANPLASRVQRVFGLSQFKIDPSLSGSNGQPSARVTLQQKITSNLTFTYITDVTQTNSEIIRVSLDLTPKISAVALRDYNGNVSVELFYKFQAR